MAHHPNEELLQRAYDAFNRGDLDALRGLVAEDIQVHVPGKSQIAGDYAGVDDFFGLFGKLAELSGGTFKVTPHAILADDDHGAVLSVDNASREGRDLKDHKTFQVFHLRDGKITEFWPLSTDDYVTDEFWG